MRFLLPRLVFMVGVTLSAPESKPVPLQFPFILKEDEQPVSSVCFCPDGKMLASASYDGTIILRDVNVGSKQLVR